MSKTSKLNLPVLAMDIGGTKISTAIISGEDRIIAREYDLTLSGEGPEAVINRTIAVMDLLLDKSETKPNQLCGISIAIAGAIDTVRGMVTKSPHLPGWHNVPLRDIVREEFRTNTIIVNDANAAALAEHRFGAGRGIKNLILLTLGTGIGGGIIINDKLYYGANGIAGEIGHMTIDFNGPKCNCGNNGCLEMFVSGEAIAREAVKRISRGEKSALLGKTSGITGEAVSAAAESGDALALAIVSEAGEALGVGILNLVNIFNPEMVIISGGMSKMGDLLLNPVRQIVTERAFPLAARTVKITLAQYVEDAGLIGAAAFIREEKETGRIK
ncbi:ROK family protein [Chloroflexota bacterium]